MTLAPSATDTLPFRDQVLSCANAAPDAEVAARLHVEDARRRVRTVAVMAGTESAAYEVAVRQLTGAVLALREIRQRP